MDSTEGRRRAGLTKRKNKQDKQIKAGLPVEDPLTPDQVVMWQALEKMKLEKTKRRDDKKNEKKNIKERMDAYSLGRKTDPNSVHNQLKDYFRLKKLDRGGKAFGGKYDGKVARSVMERPEDVYDDGFRKILKDNKRESVSGSYIDELADQVVNLMLYWNEFCSLLQKEKPTEDEKKRAPEVAKRAVRAHHALLKTSLLKFMLQKIILLNNTSGYDLVCYDF